MINKTHLPWALTATVMAAKEVHVGIDGVTGIREDFEKMLAGVDCACDQNKA